MSHPNTPLKYIALPTALVESWRKGAPDAHGQQPERATSTGPGVPCRHCLKEVEAGKDYLILAHRPFDELHPYAELGPIFICADHCERHQEADGIPAMFREWPRLLVKGYGADNRIVYGTGETVDSAGIEDHACTILNRPEVVYAHARSARNNCYICRIEVN